MFPYVIAAFPYATLQGVTCQSFNRRVAPSGFIRAAPYVGVTPCEAEQPKHGQPDYKANPEFRKMSWSKRPRLPRLARLNTRAEALDSTASGLILPRERSHSSRFRLACYQPSLTGTIRLGRHLYVARSCSK